MDQLKEHDIVILTKDLEDVTGCYFNIYKSGSVGRIVYSYIEIGNVLLSVKNGNVFDVELLSPGCRSTIRVYEDEIMLESDLNKYNL